MKRLAKRLAFLAAVLSLSAPLTRAVTFNDGQVHVIDAENSFPFEDVIVEDSPAAEATSVQILPGGRIGTSIAGNLEVFGSSQVHAFGGSVGGDFFLRESSYATISGGSFLGTTFVRQGSTAIISGGSFGPVEVRGGFADMLDPFVQIRNGSFSTLSIGGNSFGEEIVEILGGDIADLVIGPFGGGLANVRILGGTTGATESRGDTKVEISGGSHANLMALEDTTVTIRGHHFNFPFGVISAMSGTLSGTLGDGTLTDLTFGRASTAIITISCGEVGSLPASTPLLAAGQDNDCENWSAVMQPGDDLSRAGLRFVSLSSADLSGAFLIDADLAFADLSGANFTDASVSGAEMFGATYSESTIFPSGNTVETPPWGLPGGESPWGLGMKPVPEASGLLSLAVGVAWMVGMSMMRGVGRS